MSGGKKSTPQKQDKTKQEKNRHFPSFSQPLHGKKVTLDDLPFPQKLNTLNLTELAPCYL